MKGVAEGAAARAFVGWFDPGDMGVRIFFVISGFLITGLLMAEREETGAVSLRRFYYRRALRIFPAFYAFLAVLALLFHFGLLDPSSPDAPRLWVAAVYVANWTGTGNWYAAHSWSLSVEEQFYLIFPALFRFTTEGRARRALVYFLLAGAVLRTAYCALAHFKFVTFAPFVVSTTSFDAVACGCLLALWREKLRARPLYLRLVRRAWPPALALLALRVALHPSYGVRLAADLSFGFALSGVLTALLIDAVVSRPPAFLNTRPLVYVGALSYSLYLWQQIFLPPYSTSPYLRFPLCFVWIALAALASFYLVERPALKLRRRWEPGLISLPPSTPNRYKMRGRYSTRRP